jgi:hypothetical protein
MTDPFPVKWTRRLGFAVAFFALLACVNAWFYPDGFPETGLLNGILSLVWRNWLTYLVIALIGEIWLAYELLSWEANEVKPAPIS